MFYAMLNFSQTILDRIILFFKFLTKHMSSMYRSYFVILVIVHIIIMIIVFCPILDVDYWELNLCLFLDVFKF